MKHLAALLLIACGTAEETPAPEPLAQAPSAPIVEAPPPQAPPPLAVPPSLGIAECDRYAAIACGCSNVTLRPALCEGLPQQFDAWRGAIAAGPMNRSTIAQSCTQMADQILSTNCPGTEVPEQPAQQAQQAQQAQPPPPAEPAGPAEPAQPAEAPRARASQYSACMNCIEGSGVAEHPDCARCTSAECRSCIDEAINDGTFEVSECRASACR